MSLPEHRGRCLCGGVQYAVQADIKAVTHCHCQMCRKGHGAAFATYGSVPAQAHTFTAGAALLRSYRSSPGVTRSFCSACGSPLLWRREGGAFAAWLSFPLGTLDSPCVPAKQRHVHTADRLAWCAIADDWPQQP